MFPSRSSFGRLRFAGIRDTFVGTSRELQAAQPAERLMHVEFASSVRNH